MSPGWVHRPDLTLPYRLSFLARHVFGFGWIKALLITTSSALPLDYIPRLLLRLFQIVSRSALRLIGGMLVVTDRRSA